VGGGWGRGAPWLATLIVTAGVDQLLMLAPRRVCARELVVGVVIVVVMLFCEMMWPRVGR
jgi:hypothetical protein